jgi:type I restriction-modification system DNA methylase subunit/predicted type IV restriction endonuclease
METLMPAPDKITQLVERFKANLDAYRSGHYNETQVRRDFIDPFFMALGWDVDNREGYAEQYREVIHEDAIKIGGATKAPDYCFRIGGVRKFFVEAKKPSVNLDQDMSAAFQVRRYAWTAKLPLSILTDFEEFAVYDTRVKPAKTDKAATARIMYVKFDEYLDRWDEITGIFGKKSLLQGSFDRFAESGKNKRGTATVDDVFLSEIESWRDILARNLALRNKELSQRELNFAVQRIIDRIIFLRICEDRGIEPYGQLQSLQNGVNTYSRLIPIFHRADQKYNSGLFHFADERGRPTEPDKLTLDLNIDDKALKSILCRLYYPDSPYEFSVMPAEILGHVYERFLGSVIRLTAGHQAKIEVKPEVRKAGGVYYTPAYIVDYIVQQTVGKLVEGKKPKEIAKLKIGDISCGSGSFLIGAYQYLLDWHRDYYLEHGNKKEKKLIYEGHGGEWRLTTDERKRILLANIYGVDIDPQAVETTKLSLLLKVLEGENEQTLAKQMELFKQRALPDLGHNIKCGNSLLEYDFYFGKSQDLFDEEMEYHINTFDWGKSLPTIFKGTNKGFDVIIGNPPYVDIKGLPEYYVKYLFEKYSTANNRINFFSIFIERSLQLIRKDGFRFSMIIPTALLSQVSYSELRKSILSRFHIDSIVRLPNESFGKSAGDVKVDTMILTLSDSNPHDSKTEIVAYNGYERITRIDSSTAAIHGFIDSKKWTDNDDYTWSIAITEEDDLILNKMAHCGKPLIEFADFSLGLTPYDKYKGHTQEQIINKVFHSDCRKDDTFKKLLAGNDVRRYSVKWNGKSWISYGAWLGAPRVPRFFTQKRILVKQIIDWTAARIWATITDEELYNTQNAFNLLSKSDEDLEYLLGILNSKLMSYFHRKVYLDEFKMRFQKILIKDCKRLPIRPIDFKNKSDRTTHNRMVELVSVMLDLNMRLDASKTDDHKNMLEGRIAATDAEIDRLVYDLYGLTDKEIAIVEGTG